MVERAEPRGRRATRGRPLPPQSHGGDGMADTAPGILLSRAARSSTSVRGDEWTIAGVVLCKAVHCGAIP